MSRGLANPRRPRSLRREPTAAELWVQADAAAKRRAHEERLAEHIKAWGLPAPEREYRFDPARRWRSDFAWPPFMVLAEVEGVSHDPGRHQRIAGFEKDAEKYAAAQLAGWTVLRFTGRQVRKGEAIRVIEATLQRARLAGLGDDQH